MPMNGSPQVDPPPGSLWQAYVPIVAVVIPAYPPQ